MSVRQAHGYALRSFALGEADLIVELFTLERGRVRAVAKSARRIKSRFGSAFQPFTRSRIVYFQRDKDDLGRLSSCDIERSWFETLCSVEGLATSSYLSELIISLTPEHDPDPTLFRLIGACLDALEDGVDWELVCRYFEIWILRIAGLLPDPYSCASCGEALGSGAFVSEQALAFVCSRCAVESGRQGVSVAAWKAMGAVLRTPPGALAGRVTLADARALAALTRVLVRGHMGREPRSLRFLRAVR